MKTIHQRQRPYGGIMSIIITALTLFIQNRSKVTLAFTSILQKPSLLHFSTNNANHFSLQHKCDGHQRSSFYSNQQKDKHYSSSIRTCCNVAASNTELSSSSSSQDKVRSPKSNNPNANMKQQNQSNRNKINNNNQNRRPSRNKKYDKRKRTKSKYEKDREKLRKNRQEQYDLLRKQTSLESGNDKNNTPSIWGFEALFPEPVWDNESVYRDLYEVNEREKKIESKIVTNNADSVNRGNQDDLSSLAKQDETIIRSSPLPLVENEDVSTENNTTMNSTNSDKPIVDRTLTRMVEDRVYGLIRPMAGEYYYDVSSMSNGAVQFSPDGRRVGNPLKVNADRLTYHAKRELAKGHLEEARELYEEALKIDPRDGRGYLGLSRICTRRRDFVNAKKYLKIGVLNSWDPETGGRNAFLLQALGCLEERVGHLSEAERLYIQAAKERPYHAAAWVALAQLRTRKLRKGAHAGRICYQSAERELQTAGKPPSSHVYTAWASLEYRKAGNFRRAKELFEKAIECDPKCSVAYLQLGVMEANAENWDNAKRCFETVLRFDQRNSRVLQAYAIMESKRVGGDSRDVIDLFERALRAKPKDAGVLQAYALFVVDLGDIDAGRQL